MCQLKNLKIGEYLAKIRTKVCGLLLGHPVHPVLVPTQNTAYTGAATGPSSPSVGPLSSTRPVGADARPPLPSSGLVGLQWYTDQRLQMSAGCPLMAPTPSYGRPLDPTRPVFSHAPYFAAAISPRNVSPPYPESCPGPDPLDAPGAHCAVY